MTPSGFIYPNAFMFDFRAVSASKLIMVNSSEAHFFLFLRGAEAA
jgi:hypothetical protein